MGVTWDRIIERKKEEIVSFKRYFIALFQRVVVSWLLFPSVVMGVVKSRKFCGELFDWSSIFDGFVCYVKTKNN